MSKITKSAKSVAVQLLLTVAMVAGGTGCAVSLAALFGIGIAPAVAAMVVVTVFALIWSVANKGAVILVLWWVPMPKLLGRIAWGIAGLFVPIALWGIMGDIWAEGASQISLSLICLFAALMAGCMIGNAVRR